jgi:2-methylcitrate dehydratase PrpD
MEPTRALVDHLTGATFGDLPDRAVAAVKVALIDLVGAMAAGGATPAGRMVAHWVRANGGRPDAPILLLDHRAPVAEAAFANAIMARATELDDVHQGSPRLGGGHGGHLNVNVLPACLALAAGWPSPIGGKRFVLAAALGADLLVRLRLAAGPAGRLGWMGETLAPFASAAAAAVLTGATREILTNALGAAYAFCSGTNRGMAAGSWDIVLPAGHGVRAGLLSLDLARAGFRAVEEPLIGRAGLYPLYFRDSFREAVLFDGLGREFEGPNVTVKLFAACLFTHAPVAALIRLCSREGLSPDDIAGMRVRLAPYAAQLVGLSNDGEGQTAAPCDIFAAQNSLPFCLALAAHKGDLFLNDFAAPSLEDSAILDLAQRTRVVAQERETATGSADLTVELRDGRQFLERCEPVKGHPTHPLTQAEVEGKFFRALALAAKPVAAPDARRFLEAAANLDDIDDIRPVLARCW